MQLFQAYRSHEKIREEFSIDISRSPKDYLPKKVRGTRASFWASIGLLLAALAVASGVAVLGTWLLQRLLPATPVYVGLIIGVLALALVLVWIAKRFVWIMPWYYLLPSLLFLITFTIMPVGLTIFLAFTDYAGNRNTQLNPTTETAIVQAQGSSVQTQVRRITPLRRALPGLRRRTGKVYGCRCFSYAWREPRGGHPYHRPGTS